MKISYLVIIINYWDYFLVWIGDEFMWSNFLLIRIQVNFFSWFASSWIYPQNLEYRENFHQNPGNRSKKSPKVMLEPQMDLDHLDICCRMNQLQTRLQFLYPSPQRISFIGSVHQEIFQRWYVLNGSHGHTLPNSKGLTVSHGNE